MQTKPIAEAKGKIAFIFPSKYSSSGASSPTLNFIPTEKRLAMSIGISFVELDPLESYLVTFKLIDSSGEAVFTSADMDAIPSDQIDPQMRTSFLAVSFYFDFDKFGTYRFSCDLVNMLYNYGNPIDSKEIMFNVFNHEAECE